MEPCRLLKRIIIGSTQSQRTLTKRYNIPPEKIRILPYPVDTRIFTQQPVLPTPLAGGKPLRVLWLGRIIPRKRMDLFLEAAARPSRDGVPALFARCHLFAQPSEEESFGASVAEAHACGLPVVVGTRNGNADYVGFREIQKLAEFLHFGGGTRTAIEFRARLTGAQAMRRTSRSSPGEVGRAACPHPVHDGC